jgi:broad specificity phosphatase PhoE
MPGAMRFPIAALLAVTALASPVRAAPGPAATDSAITTVIVVRHAEKNPHPSGGDAGLNEAGNRRARELAETLRDAGVRAIYASPFFRTRATALPLAAALHDSVRVMGPDDAEGLARRVHAEHRGQTVLVVGHSDTVPVILETLLGRRLPALGEIDYDRLFIVTLAPGRPASLLALRYGEPVAAK